MPQHQIPLVLKWPHVVIARVLKVQEGRQLKRDVLRIINSIELPDAIDELPPADLPGHVRLA